jgi:bacterioferritin-associated ferredoxin
MIHRFVTKCDLCDHEEEAIGVADEIHCGKCGKVATLILKEEIEEKNANNNRPQ